MPDAFERLFQREPLAERAGLLQRAWFAHRQGEEERLPSTQILNEVVGLDARDGLRILGLALLAQDPRILLGILGLLQLFQSLLDDAIAGWGESAAHHGPGALLSFLDEEDHSTSQHVDQLQIARHGWVIDEFGQRIVARSDEHGAGCADKLAVPVHEIAGVQDGGRIGADKAIRHAWCP